MIDAETMARAGAVSVAIRAYYLSLPGKTAEGWDEVMLDPRKFNMTWRHMLKHACGQTDLDITRYPPPIHLQSLLPGESYDA